VTDLAKQGVYERDFQKGSVLVNPSGAAVMVTLSAPMKEVVATGGGAIDSAGKTTGSITMNPASTTVTVPATGAMIVLQ
jgi:hypothetical protein